MKAALLLLLAAITLTLSACAGGPYEASYSYRAYQPAQRSYYQSNRSYWDGQQTYVAGPSYYRAYDAGCGGNTRYRNYSNAPVIVERPQGNIIVPHSWN